MEENNMQNSVQNPMPQAPQKVKKPIFKKWWFWVIIVAVLILIISAAGGSGDDANPTDKPGISQGDGTQASAPTESETAKKEKLELLESDVEVDSFTRQIVGKIKNNTNREYSYVQVEFSLYDEDGALVGTAFTNVNNLEAGGVWKFEALILEDSAVSYKLKEITGW